MAKDLPDIVEWEAYEYIHKEQSTDWFWGVGITATVLAVAAIIFSNLLLAIVIVIGTFTITLLSLKHPDLKYFALTPRGVVEGDTMYPYSELEVFWISDQFDPPKVLIRSRRTFAPLITIPLPESADTQLVHDYLFQHIDDEPLSESALEKLLDRLGF